MLIRIVVVIVVVVSVMIVVIVAVIVVTVVIIVVVIVVIVVVWQHHCNVFVLEALAAFLEALVQRVAVHQARVVGLLDRDGQSGQLLLREAETRNGGQVDFGLEVVAQRFGPSKGEQLAAIDTLERTHQTLEQRTLLLLS